MAGSSAAWGSRWEAYWFAPVAPHSAALIRIMFGGLVLACLAGMTPVEMFWSLNGLAPLPGNPAGIRWWLLDHGFGSLVGHALFVWLAVAATAALVGYKSGLAVLATFAGLWLQPRWNRLPLSSAHQVLLAVFFCLIWMETGQVWSVDAWRRARGPLSTPLPLPVIWPLRLMRFQISVIYMSSALWKLLSPSWRDGSAVHWVLSQNMFQRFPWPVPASVEPVLPLLTWGILAFEFLFPLLIWYRATRTATLVIGLGLHLGLWLTLELGPFSFIMAASYVAFLDPAVVEERLQNTFRNPHTIPSSRTSIV